MIINKKFFSICSIIFLLLTSLIQPIRSIDDSSKLEILPPTLTILKSDRNEVIFNISLNGINIEDVKINDEIYHRISLPKYGFLDTIGKPKLPAIRLFFAVPPEVNKINLSLLNAETSLYNNINVLPVQEPIPESTNKHDFQLNTSFYSQDEFYPEQMVFIESSGYIRNYKYIQVTINPIQYNPSTNELKIYNVTQVKIQFDGSEKGFIKEIDGFNIIYNTLFINYENSKNWYHQKKKEVKQRTQLNTSDLLNSTNRAGLLIITNDTFYQSVKSFANWKNQKGWETFIANISTIYSQFPAGSNFDSIRDFINYTFYHWDRTPSHVLLIGDVEYIPTYYYQGDTPSDHWYSCIVGNDYFSDILVGRISVKNITEMLNIAEKIINYEKNPYLNETLWYKRSMLVSDSGYFETTSDWVYNFLLNHGYTSDKFYDSQGTATTANIANAINEGRAIANYRGHGGTTGWGTGPFSNSDVLSLTNDRKLPIVISPTCSTGHYDDPYTDCYGETWLKAPNKGGVSFWGSSRVSYGGYNDELDMGVYKAIFNDNIYNFGGFTNKAKLYMISVYGTSPMALLEIHLFNVIGDSTVEFWTDIPKPLNVTHQTSVGSQNSQFIVTVKNDTIPLENACVVIEKKPDLYMVGYTNSTGQVQFIFTNISLGHINVTVTKHDYIPYLANISVYNNISLSEGWNFVSFPHNLIINKQNISIKYDDSLYEWQEAVSSYIINDYIFSWNRTNQTYTISNIIQPGHGFWLYSYKNADLWIQSTSIFNGHITTVLSDWNIFGIPYHIDINKSELVISNESGDYNWSEAVSNGLINNFIFGWNNEMQSYSFKDVFKPGYAYWIYVYQTCTIKKVD